MALMVVTIAFLSSCVGTLPRSVTLPSFTDTLTCIAVSLSSSSSRSVLRTRSASSRSAALSAVPMFDPAGGLAGADAVGDDGLLAGGVVVVVVFDLSAAWVVVSFEQPHTTRSGRQNRTAFMIP